MRKRMQGLVVSDKMSKTVVVQVSRTKAHPKYKRRYRIDKKFKAHVKEGEYKVGDNVVIEETRPISKDKHWKVVSKV